MWIIVLFLSAVSFWRHPFTAGYDMRFTVEWYNKKFSKYVVMKKKTNLLYILDGMGVSKF